MNDAVKEYILQFYYNPKELEEYKINFLKNHFYDKVNNIKDVSINYKDFLIGIYKSNNLVYFSSKKDKSLQIIYNTKMDIYYKYDIEKKMLLNIEFKDLK